MKKKKVSGYVDMFVLPVPKKNLAAYKKLANKFGKIMKEHGALEYREFLGDDLLSKGVAHFPKRFKLKPEDVLISSFIGFQSKKHRDSVNKKAMSDPRMKKLMPSATMFDMKSMHYGGFSTIVDMNAL